MARLAAQLPSATQHARAAAPRRAPSKKLPPAQAIPVKVYKAHALQVIISLSNVQKGLQHVQNGLNDLMSTYIKFTSSVLGGEEGALLSLELPENVAESAQAALAAAGLAINDVTQNVTAVPAAAVSAAPETGKTKKRKREKKEKDPNAPKRPLTAAFLYAQAARPVVKRDLESTHGEKLEPNAVQIEINKRWNELPEEEKEEWKKSYRESREKWKEENAAYLAAKGEAAVAALHDEEDASDDAEAEAGALDSDAESDSEDEVEAASPIAKAPSPPVTNGKTARPNKRQKTAANGAAPAPIAQAQTPIPLPRSSVSLPKASVELPAATPVKKDNKKKKAEPKPIAPAPEKEPSPDDTKKKTVTKGSRVTRNAEAAEEQENSKPVAKKRDRSKRKGEAGAS
ncbi:hypothetical protein P280DRAFT_471474 [Massarina eburnea CBS 473.64]|uniref:HMG box domain-containing protein n=1 Tax=Massarina eburnea CBS 473.64 TaxID=1395130 RepID=A0A6A6RS88_9PLEO|nr:hypothetical protein P280DRAFT_471474 [Massarina eburnea CBS 473.64]